MRFARTWAVLAIYAVNEANIKNAYNKFNMYEPNSQKSISQHSQSDYLYDSYSSESDQERANFIINAKKLIEAKIANKVNKQ